MEEIKKNYWGITWKRGRKASWVEILLLFSTFFSLFHLKECNPCHRFSSVLEQHLVKWRKTYGFQSLEKTNGTIQGLLLFHPQPFQCVYFLYAKLYILPQICFLASFFCRIIELYNSLFWKGPLNIGKQGCLQLGQVAQNLV